MRKYLLLCILFLGSFPAGRVSAQVSLDSQRNYSSCLHGYSGCDQSKLTDAELAEVRQAAQRRNYNACLRGYFGCDQSQLTDSQRAEVQQSASRRNYNDCLHGYYDCDLSKLTNEER